MKILIFLVVVFVLLWLLRGATTNRRRDGAARPPQAPQEMIACAHCGVLCPACACLGGPRCEAVNERIIDVTEPKP